MASIKEAFDSTIGESFTGLKLLLWAIPLTYCRDVISSGGLSFIATCILGAFSLLFIGFLAESAYNAIDKKPVIVPGFNILTMALNGFKTIFALGIYVAIAYFGATIANSYINLGEHKVWQDTIQVLIWFLFLSLPVSALMVYARKLDLFDAFNLKKIFQVMGDTFLMFSYLVIKLFLLSLIVIGFISYMFWLFVGLENGLINFIWSIAILYNLIIGVNYIAQFSEEQFTVIEKQEGKDKMEGAKLY